LVLVSGSDALPTSATPRTQHHFPRIYSGACQQKSSELNQLQQTPEQARGKWCVVIECQEESAAPAPAPHPKTHAEIPPPGFSAVKAHAREAAPKAALTALNPGGPLAGKGFGGSHAVNVANSKQFRSSA
tara:strand:+ start:20 stop:409 length:390 start_codon:yes stop_codon:yes gene_type:complete